MAAGQGRPFAGSKMLVTRVPSQGSNRSDWERQGHARDGPVLRKSGQPAASQGNDRVESNKTTDSTRLAFSRFVPFGVLLVRGRREKVTGASPSRFWVAPGRQWPEKL